MSAMGEIHFNQSFEVTVPAKWILSGEHAVLRGVKAIAMPHPEFSLQLKFVPSKESDRNSGIQTEPEMLKVVLDPLIEKAFQLKGVSTVRPKGKLIVESTIPMGSGLGSSAALCVAITQWLSGPLKISNEERLSFATQLEDIFHGKSSGLDVATCLKARPLIFKRGEQPSEIDSNIDWQNSFHFRFHDSGFRSSTRECILKVEDWIQKHSVESGEIDEKMGRAFEYALLGLTSGNSSQMKNSFDLSWECFQKWGLLSPGAEDLKAGLIKQGALAVRMTGAGLGGYLVSLWPGKPLENLR